MSNISKMKDTSKKLGRITYSGKSLIKKMAEGARSIYIFNPQGKGLNVYSSYGGGHCGELYTTLTVRSLMHKGLLEEHLDDPDMFRLGVYIGKVTLSDLGREYYEDKLKDSSELN